MPQDSAHDWAHLQRVVATAQRLAQAEQADLKVVTVAAWLHDLVNYPKHHPERQLASQAAAQQAGTLLAQQQLPQTFIEAVQHAIAAHSFSAKIAPQTIEAKVVQDADRLDALGAIGMARCFMVGGALQRALYDFEDPFCQQRAPDDQAFTLDHFYQKLLRLEQSFTTQAGREEAAQRTQFMRQFLGQLKHEISPEFGWDTDLG
ncbi:HD domain-containing protein [Marinomonas ostreistagni]|nr:HD domain-containing protein [Marinomonas ostreistagni]